jgi:hypothetical protein
VEATVAKIRAVLARAAIGRVGVLEAQVLAVHQEAQVGALVMVRGTVPQAMLVQQD